MILPFLFVAFLATCSRSAAAEDNPMDVFAPMVGKWTTETIHKPSQRDPKEWTGKGTITAKRILNNRFIQLQGTESSNTKQPMKFKVIMTYDQRKRTYRRWVFGSDGLIAESAGKWNADEKTMTWTTIGLPKSVNFTVTTTIKEDGLEVTLLGKREDGTVLMHSTTKARKKT